MDGTFSPTIRTEPELLRFRASVHPERRAFTFLADGQNETATLTYSELDSWARSISAILTHHGVSAGDRVLLLLPPGLEFIAAFWGCLYGGVAAVTAPPSTSRRSLPRLMGILKDCAPAALLAPSAQLAQLAALRDLASELEPGSTKTCLFIPIEGCVRNATESGPVVAVTRGTIALIQYTSGSTASPKGVVITHGNLFHNQEMIRLAMSHGETSSFVSWLPQFHDMGLIGNLCQPLHLGTNCVFFSPEVFLRAPVLWLRAITTYRAHTSGAPNFAYAYCAKKISDADKVGLDLRSWQVAYNGAEPIRAGTLRAFVEAFASVGFSARAFYPTYGLAEATLLVAGGVKGEAPNVRRVARASLSVGRIVSLADPDTRDTCEVVSCGTTDLGGQRVVIVDPSSCVPCSEGEVGEIWIDGQHVAAGYWNRQDETVATFRASLASNSADDAGDRAFLRTGDLGFRLRGELFVTSRLKDVLIFRGANYYPHDLELVIEDSHELFAAGCSVVFSVADPDAEVERLIVVAECRRDDARRRGRDAVRSAIAALAQCFGLAVSEILIVPRGTIPRTTSGKQQRALCRDRYLGGQLRPLELGGSVEEVVPLRSGPAVSDVLSILLSEVARICEVASVDERESVVHYGLDSVKALDLQYAMESRVGLRLTPAVFLRARSISDAARALEIATPEAVKDGVEEVEARTRDRELSWAETAVWFEQQRDPSSPAYNVNFVAKVFLPVDLAVIEGAVATLCANHPELHTRYSASIEGPVARIDSTQQLRVETVDCSGMTSSAFLARVAERAHAPFDVSRDLLVRCYWFTSDRNVPVLLISAHHVLLDLWGMVQLVGELLRCCSRVLTGEDVELEAAAPYSHFVAWEREVIGSQGEQLWQFWRRRVPRAEDELTLPTDYPRPMNLSRAGTSLPFRLGGGTVERLRLAARGHGVTAHSILLSAWASVLSRWTATDRVVVGGMISGRPRREYMRTLGHFANPVIFNLDLGGDPTCAKLFRRTHGEVVEILDSGAMPFGLLVRQAQPIRHPHKSPWFQTMFVYQQVPSHPELAPCVLSQSEEHISCLGVSLEVVPLEVRCCRYDLTLYIVDCASYFESSLVYNTSLFRSETVDRLRADFVSALVTMLEEPDLLLSELKARREVGVC